MVTNKQAIYMGSDHAGFAMKRWLVEELRKANPSLVFHDLGTQSESSCDYPDFAKIVAEKVIETGSRGILVCGTGTGMSIAANKVKGIRAAVAYHTTSARLSREHNDANILCLGSRLIGQEVALDACRIWLNTEFAGGRHQQRIEKVRKLEEGSC